MMTKTAWSPVLACTGIAALLFYILACTSFSPDDSKILYPGIVPDTGMLGVAVYDREARKSEWLFVPHAQDLSDESARTGFVLQPQWLADGREIAVAWTGKDPGARGRSDALHVAVLPYGRTGPVRLFQLEGVEDPWSQLLRPLPIAGQSLFLLGKSNLVLRLDLASGRVGRGTLPDDTSLLASPGNQGPFYLTQLDEAAGQTEFGKLHPDSLERTSIGPLKIQGAEGPLIFSPERQCLAYVTKDQHRQVIRVLEPGKPDRTLSLESLGPGVKFGNGQFSPRGDVLYAAFMEQGNTGTNTSFGFAEITMDGRAAQKTVLLSDVPKRDEGDIYLFPIEVSHDGKTLAAISTYLAVDREIKGADGALFLVDLTDATRKVTTVPVPPRWTR